MDGVALSRESKLLECFDGEAQPCQGGMLYVEAYDGSFIESLIISYQFTERFKMYL